MSPDTVDDRDQYGTRFDWHLAESNSLLVRYIRSETDRGLLVVCDPRMAAMGYGRRLFAALPPMTRVEREAEALDWLAKLAAEPLSA